MRRFTLREAEERARHYASELTVEASVDAGSGAGLLLTSRTDSPGVLGIAAVDVTGEYAPVALDREEAFALRDALTNWLNK